MTSKQVISRLLQPIIGLAFAGFVPVASAHHGFASHFYPDRMIRIEGTVKQFDFVNPHGALHIESVNDAGETVVYVCDLQARTQLVRRGVDETLFKTGDPIVVDGFEARRDPLRCEFGTAFFADGSSFTMRSSDKAQTKFADNRKAYVAPGESRSVFGVWIRPDIYGAAGGRGRRTGDDSITAAGKKALESFDPFTDNPVLKCRGGSPVRNWGAPGLATSISQEGDKIIIYHESMDVTRTVHMNLSEHPADVPPSEMGHSIGRFDDRSLIIDTAAFTGGVLIGSMLRTDRMTLQERLTVQEDTGDLLISWTANEPVYYSEPLAGSQRLQSTDRELIRYDCVPDSPSNH